MKVICCICGIVIREDIEGDESVSHDYCAQCYERLAINEGFPPHRMSQIDHLRNCVKIVTKKDEKDANDKESTDKRETIGESELGVSHRKT